MIGGDIFICENNRKMNKIIHCVEKKILSASFEDIAIFHVNLEIDRKFRAKNS